MPAFAKLNDEKLKSKALNSYKNQPVSQGGVSYLTSGWICSS